MVTEVKTAFDKLISKLNSEESTCETELNKKFSNFNTQKRQKENRSVKSYGPIAKSLTYL